MAPASAWATLRTWLRPAAATCRPLPELPSTSLPMPLHIPTVMLIAALSSAATAIGLWVIARAIRDDESLRIWARGASAVAMSYLLFILKGVLPDALTVVVANVLMVGGHAQVWRGSLRFAGLPPRTAWELAAAGVALVGSVWLTYLLPDQPMRIVLISGVAAVFLLLNAVTLLRLRDAALQALLRALGIGFAIYGTLIALRAVLAPFTSVGQGMYGVSHELLALAFTFTVVVHIFIAIGLVLLVA